MIVDLTRENKDAIRQIAELLLNGFRETGSTSWRHIDEAAAEVVDSLQADRISRIAIDERGVVAGWIAGI
ncbi:MAG: N-acetyltransferase, partial [Acidobacteria bacterium]